MVKIKDLLAEAFDLTISCKDKITLDKVVKIADNTFGRVRLDKELPNGGGLVLVRFQRKHHLDTAKLILDRNKIKIQ